MRRRIPFSLSLSLPLFEYLLLMRSDLFQEEHELRKHRTEAHSESELFESCSFRQGKKKLLHQRSLRDHELMNGSARSHECATCGKSFLRSSSLRTHMIVHTADSPYACDLCPAKFKRSSVLKTHQLTHTGVRRFECDICKHRFHLKGALKHHVLAHYGELVNILTTSPGSRMLARRMIKSRSRRLYFFSSFAILSC
jgi:uncharacterized Zn-finger protein